MIVGGKILTQKDVEKHIKDFEEAVEDEVTLTYNEAFILLLLIEIINNEETLSLWKELNISQKAKVILNLCDFWVKEDLNASIVNDSVLIEISKQLVSNKKSLTQQASEKLDKVIDDFIEDCKEELPDLEIGYEEVNVDGGEVVKTITLSDEMNTKQEVFKFEVKE